MDIRWARMHPDSGSWHAIQHESDAGHSTFCGRVATGEVVDDLPGERSCELCLRIIARLDDAEAAL